jgi:hypothetical protein
MAAAAARSSPSGRRRAADGGRFTDRQPTQDQAAIAAAAVAGVTLQTRASRVASRRSICAHSPCPAHRMAPTAGWRGRSSARSEPHPWPYPLLDRTHEPGPHTPTPICFRDPKRIDVHAHPAKVAQGLPVRVLGGLLQVRRDISGHSPVNLGDQPDGILRSGPTQQLLEPFDQTVSGRNPKGVGIKLSVVPCHIDPVTGKVCGIARSCRPHGNRLHRSTLVLLAPEEVAAEIAVELRKHR